MCIRDRLQKVHNLGCGCRASHQTLLGEVYSECDELVLSSLRSCGRPTTPLGFLWVDFVSPWHAFNSLPKTFQVVKLERLDKSPTGGFFRAAPMQKGGMLQRPLPPMQLTIPHPQTE